MGQMRILHDSVCNYNFYKTKKKCKNDLLTLLMDAPLAGVNFRRVLSNPARRTNVAFLNSKDQGFGKFSKAVQFIH